jgi:hypothetical protein
MIDNGVNKFDEVVGLLKRATIVNYLPDRDIIQVKLAAGQSALKGQSPLVPIDVPAPHGLFDNNGLFIGTLPDIGTPVVIGQGSGGQYHFVSFLAENITKVPVLKSGELLIRGSETAVITLNKNNDISVGSETNKIHINAQSNLITTNFNNENHFTQASRKIEGVVKRDLLRNTKFDQNNKLESDDYDSKFKIIGMDPSSNANSVITGPYKNPPLVESREIIYEFQFESEIENDAIESLRYSDINTDNNYTFPNRRNSRADLLSLSLVAPNYLIETVKGTVVDIFGNILDLNRYPLPIGTDQATINKDSTIDKSEAFLLIKELERKSLAYHFEINTRKDLQGQPATNFIDSSDDYARIRSRFFLDIDKEGQFKLNVPASSEKGNIPLLTRYENYSTFGSEDNGNPNKLVFQGAGNNFDVYQDSFASPILTPSDGGFLPSSDKGSITLKTSSGADGAPQDRLTGNHIKHGMVFHDILQTCFAHQNNQFINYPTNAYISPILNNIPTLNNVVSKTIVIDGDEARAGGRSGSLNFDGSLELNIGANTIDRQSMWCSMAGGAVYNIGRDINGRSIMAATGGDFYLQVGGFGITGDSRFEEGGINPQDNSIKGAVLDLRILSNGGYCHMIRIDDNGITLMTPGNMAIHAKGALELTSDQSIRIEAPNVTMQKRLVLNAPMGSI